MVGVEGSLVHDGSQVGSQTPGSRRAAGRQIANTYDKPSGAEFNRREKGDILVFPGVEGGKKEKNHG